MKKVAAEPHRDIDFSVAVRGPVIPPRLKGQVLHASTRAPMNAAGCRELPDRFSRNPTPA